MWLAFLQLLPKASCFIQFASVFMYKEPLLLLQMEPTDSEVIIPNIIGIPSPRKAVGGLLQRVTANSPVKPASSNPVVTPRRSLNGPSSVAQKSVTPRRKSSSKSSRPESLFDMSTQVVLLQACYIQYTHNWSGCDISESKVSSLVSGISSIRFILDSSPIFIISFSVK